MNEVHVGVRESLIQSRNGFWRSANEAKRWLAYNIAALAYYEAWLNDPDLNPPSRPFPEYRPEQETRSDA